MNRSRLTPPVAGLAVLACMLLAAGCGGTSSGSDAGGGEGLTLVAYSTPKEAYEEIIPAFGKTAAGKGVSFDQSYGSSGEQSAPSRAGSPADVVALSLAPDVDKLVKAGLVEADWKQDKYGGFVTNSVVVFAVRKGNPKNIKTWDDLHEARRRGDHAEPVHLGRRALEHHGGVRRAARAGQDRGRGDRVPRRAVRATCRCRTRARASRSRRSRPARATC